MQTAPFQASSETLEAQTVSCRQQEEKCSLLFFF